MKGDQPYKLHLTAGIAAVKDFLDNNPVDGKTTRELALLANVNRTALQTGFKGIYGMDIRQYRKKLRMELAAQFLREGKPVKQVSVVLRYKSQSAFCTAFKSHFRLSPTDWQKRNAKP
jgi:AraC-like DNA-binding protein